MSLISRNPATGEIIKEYEEISEEALRIALTAADTAFRDWKKLSFARRGSALLACRDVLLKEKEGFARLMAMEMGKPIVQGRSEIEKCAACCEFYATNAEDFLRPEAVATEAAKSYVSFEPLGVVLAIMPWNFPFWQVFRFAAPALMAGNAALLKHASNVSGCAMAIEAVFREAGLPNGLFRSLLVSSRRMARVISDPVVRAVTLTGSNHAGEEVAAQAGGVIKKTVLELGGSDPYVILEDADLDLAVRVCAQARLVNSGQSCIAAKRFIVVQSVLEEFEDKLVAALLQVKLGDPLQEETQLGPLARLDLRETLHRQVEESVAQGAKLLCGGAIPEGSGAFYPPTVLTRVRPGMPAFDEETFGPLAAIVSARDEADAVELANRSCFGLGAAVFTRDLRRGEVLAKDFLEAGSCFVNAQVRSDPRLPFGGVKASGYGRELSAFGIREFVNVKTVFVSS